MPMMEKDEILFTVEESTLGRVLVARSNTGLCAVLMGDDEETLERDVRQRFRSADVRRDDRALGLLGARVVAFLEAPEAPLDVPLDLRGTEFQRAVWTALRAIPAGATASYAEVATQIGRPGSVRAVAGACAANALAVVIPCHRVVRSDGGLSGYRWGVERKRDLLRREAGTTSG
jgi:AraC family transcriptional regulator of adaptative response/methylated-DNA-[protein]-cysteine methyltransferase